MSRAIPVLAPALAGLSPVHVCLPDVPKGSSGKLCFVVFPYLASFKYTSSVQHTFSAESNETIVLAVII